MTSRRDWASTRPDKYWQKSVAAPSRAAYFYERVSGGHVATHRLRAPLFSDEHGFVLVRRDDNNTLLATFDTDNLDDAIKAASVFLRLR